MVVSRVGKEEVVEVVVVEVLVRVDSVIGVLEGGTSDEGDLVAP